jgi:hypothetical protein
VCAAALVALALIPAACGSSSASPGNSSSGASKSGASGDNGLKFSQCMREHGIKNFPNPETTSNGLTRLRFKVRPGEVSPQTMEAAQKACKAYQPGAAEQAHLSPQERVEHEEAVNKFAKCMREHGIHVQTSTNGGIGIAIHVGRGENGPNPESPAFQAAQKACQSLLPHMKGGGGPATGTANGGGSGPSTETQAGG